jgi:hypothetical protein
MLRINESYRKLFPDNCPVIEVDGDGEEVGTCTYYMPDGVCPRHGRLAEDIKDDDTLTHSEIVGIVV